MKAFFLKKIRGRRLFFRLKKERRRLCFRQFFFPKPAFRYPVKFEWSLTVIRFEKVTPLFLLKFQYRIALFLGSDVNKPGTFGHRLGELSYCYFPATATGGSEINKNIANLVYIMCRGGKITIGKFSQSMTKSPGFVYVV